MISTNGGTNEASPLWQRLRTAPLLAAPQVAESHLSDFLSVSPAGGIVNLAREPGVRALLLALADHSPFLWRLAKSDPARLTRCFELPPEDCLRACLTGLQASCAGASSEAEAMRALRIAKQETGLLIALADLGGAFDPIAATRCLSEAADAFISAALRFLLTEAAKGGWLCPPDPANPEEGCGLMILGLGKLGGQELNYSSDVDLVVFFDPQCAALAPSVEPKTAYVRLTKSLVRLLQERTGDGYALRVDLRLRPDPGSTPVAIALPAAYAYYESLGQNWERAAYIKARPVAGDKALADSFLANLTPFVWRKYFDYATIADIAAMKRQIHAVHGHSDIAIAGHDIKLGRGGIREIEFFVQTQQLVFGGKRPRLRGSSTLETLSELGRQGWISERAVCDLRSAYLFLREIEHRLQMIADEQTQRLPKDHNALERLARFCGFESAVQFRGELTRHFERVMGHYQLLFEKSSSLDAAAGNLVFTGGAQDPETLETLAALGFKNPACAADTVRGWHYGRRRGVQTPREREVLTELIPQLLQSFSRSGDPEAALAGFDSIINAMPAAAELFSLLRSNPAVCDLFGEILGGAPRLARAVICRPHVLDAAVDANVLTAPLDKEAFEERLGAVLQSKRETEDFLDGLRDFAQEELFPIGLRLWSGMIEPHEAAEAYSHLAQAIIDACFAHIQQAFAREHGHVPQGRAAILALGKLGSREMTATSDLDLMFIYDFDSAHPESSGPRPLHAIVYYTRLAQRLISGLTVSTRRGRLYDVDMRLRPSGRQGPLATQFSSFLEYQTNEAETWEHMALTRARFIGGDAQLGAWVMDTIRAVLMRRRSESLAREVYEMRQLIAAAKGDVDPWDLKLAAGGLIDLEFLAQYLILRHACDKPEILRPSITEAIEIAGRLSLLDESDASILSKAYQLFTAISQILRLTLDAGSNPREASDAVKRRLAKAAGEPSLSALESSLSETRASVRGVFEKILSSR